MGEVGLRAPSCDLPSCNATWNSEGCLSFGEGQHWDNFDKAWSPSGKMGDGWAPQDRFNPACQSVECQWEMASDPDAHCLPAFLLYSSQFIAALGSLAFGIISVMFARSVRAAEAAKVKDTMHGRYFAKNKILASYVPEPTLDKKFRLIRS